jgi:type IV pilus assembly protein PilA
MLSQSQSTYRSPADREPLLTATWRWLVARGKKAGGFSLPEVLVVVLILGVLLAVAVPLFWSTAAKATDTPAKQLASSAVTAAEAIAAANGGQYEKVTPTELHATDATIQTSSSSGTYLSKTTHAANEYSVTATAPSGDEFTISRDASGTISKTCVSPVTKTGCAGGETSSW